MPPNDRTPPLTSTAQQRAWRQRLRGLIRDVGFVEPATRDWQFLGLDRIVSAPVEGPFWELEPTPLVVSAGEWASIEAGLRQRARFVNAMLVDLYDRQEVLKQGLIPPDVILGDPYYRRPCLRLEPDRDTPATLLNFDLIKTSAGWHLAQTRVNTPIGLSYAVQNRRFMTQEAGELYRRLPDHHSIINFPLQLLDTLRQLSPRGTDSPAIVLLTSGPQDPFYTEHSFLARKMGVPLARGDDLLVLDNRVYFKTIGGLEPVDVIYRRLNDAHIDPVVFDTNREAAGVPGLVQCIRAGTVVVANAIGTGVAESRALDAWLPRLMRFYLGEKPLLPAPPTYTCGDNDQLDFVLENRDTLQLRPAHDPRLGDPRLLQPPALWDENGLAAEVRENPYAYVAQPKLISEPLDPGARRSGPFRFSAFVLASGREFAVLPGGLVRLGEDAPAVDRVGVTADAVVLRGEDATICEFPPELAEPDDPAHVARYALGSRSAESLFWLGRYTERAESTARMLGIMDEVVLEEIPARERRRWLPLWQGVLDATGHSGERITARERPDEALTGDLTWRMTLESRHMSSLYSSVVSAVFNARKLRDYVSPEAWSVIRRLLSRLEGFRRHGEKVKPAKAKVQTKAAIEAVLADINAFLSTADRTMVHDASWHFLSIGIYVERAGMTCSALRHVLGERALSGRESSPGSTTRIPSRDNPELSALLRMLGSQDAYRRLYQAHSQPRHVADFFLRQPVAPRSIYYNLVQIGAALDAVEAPPAASAPVKAALANLLRRLKDLNPSAELGSDPAAVKSLGEFISSFMRDLWAFHPLLSDHYFTHQASVAESANSTQPAQATEAN